MHTVFALLCFVVVIHWLIFPHPSGLLHWHCGNLTIAPVPAKQPWWKWINTLCEFIMNDCITTTKQSTTKPCAYFLGYTVTLCKGYPSAPSYYRNQCSFFVQWHLGIHCNETVIKTTYSKRVFEENIFNMSAIFRPQRVAAPQSAIMHVLQEFVISVSWTRIYFGSTNSPAYEKKNKTWNVYENVVSKRLAILFRPHYVTACYLVLNYFISLVYA